MSFQAISSRISARTTRDERRCPAAMDPAGPDVEGMCGTRGLLGATARGPRAFPSPDADPMSDYVFLADSNHFPRHLVEDLADLIAEAEEIDLEEFRDEIGRGAYEGIEHALGYDPGRLEEDDLVSAHRGTLRNVPAVFLVHSAAEYVYVPQKERKTLLRAPRQGL